MVFCALQRLLVFVPVFVLVAFSEVVLSDGNSEYKRVISALWLGPNQHQIVEGVHQSAVVTGKFVNDVSTSGSVTRSESLNQVVVFQCYLQFPAGPT